MMGKIINICDTCRPGAALCWPFVGEFAEEGQDPSEVCPTYRKRVDTNWVRFFGTPERAARTIADGCGSDCCACIVPEGCPCFNRFGVDDEDIPKLLEWLESEVRDD